MNQKVNLFNLRVYGILINSKKEVLLSKEHKSSLHFTKFPGGGLEFGEGTTDCLKREFQEELGIEIEIEGHFYTTDFFQESAFNEKHQLISIYYLINSHESTSIENGMLAIDPEADARDHFIWKSISELEVKDVTYPIDQKIISMLRQKF